MSSTTAEATMNALRTVFATRGLLEELISDSGAQFIAHEFKDFLRSNKIKHILSTPYHPASNGEAKRAVKTFKQWMKAAKGDPGTQNQKITSFLLSYCTNPQTYRMYTSRTADESQTMHQIRSATSRPEEERC